MKIVVTRHPALVTLLIERGLIEPDTPVIAHATPEDVFGKHVFGVLPLWLASYAEIVTEIPLALTEELRERGELDLDTLRAIAGEARSYKVFELHMRRRDNEL